MNEDNKAGPSCSLLSRPVEEVVPITLKNIEIPKVKELLAETAPVVIILDAEWCGDCRNQMRNLPQFEKSLQSVGIPVYVFTVEGPVYDKFISPAHKELAMRFYTTPIGSHIFGDDIRADDDQTSVMKIRGREGYPAIFLIADGKVQHWSIEDVSVLQLEKLAKIIVEKSTSF